MLLDQRVLLFGRKHADGSGNWIDDDIVAHVARYRNCQRRVAEYAAEQLRRRLTCARNCLGLLQALLARAALRLGALGPLLRGQALIPGGCQNRPYIVAQRLPEVVVRHCLDDCVRCIGLSACVTLATTPAPRGAPGPPG